MKLGVLMMVQLISGEYSLEGRTYCSFGLKCGNIRFEDISTDRSAVENLVCLCNRYEVSSEHLADLIDDFLAAPDDVQFTRQALPCAQLFLNFATSPV